MKAFQLVKFMKKVLANREVSIYVYGNDGQEHTVDHRGVANHPGDKGMQAIADRIIEALQ